MKDESKTKEQLISELEELRQQLTNTEKELKESRNISERKQMEQLLQESRRAQAVAKTGSWRLNINLNELIWSDETYRIFGIPKGTPMTYETFISCVHPDDRAYVDSKWEAALNGTEYDIDHRIVVNDEIRWVNEKAELEFSQEGVLTGGFGTVRDITERKKAEEKFQELYEKEMKLREGLEKERKKRIEFTRVLVHELKTPLTPIMASSHLLSEELQDETLKRLAKNISQGASNLSNRIDELLDLARGEIGTLQLELKSIDPLQLLRRIAGEIAPVASQQEHTLIVDLPPSLPPVQADESRLRQIILNLLNNAFKFTPDGGKVTLRAKEKDSTLVIEIQDTGLGIEKEDQERLFDPYYRVESDRQRFTGMGLGLALCKTLVDHHGGHIWVDSCRGKGSTFGFSIPLEA